MPISYYPGNLYLQLKWPQINKFSYVIAIRSNVVTLLEIRNGVCLTNKIALFDFEFRHKQVL
jgi:hypothetical protein